MKDCPWDCVVCVPVLGGQWVFSVTQLYKRGCMRSVSFHGKAGRAHLLEGGELIGMIHLSKSRDLYWN